jgi:hypothetical protein
VPNTTSKSLGSCRISGFSAFCGKLKYSGEGERKNRKRLIFDSPKGRSVSYGRVTWVVPVIFTPPQPKGIDTKLSEQRAATQLQWKSSSRMSTMSLPSILSGDLQLADATSPRCCFSCKCFVSHITEQSHSNKLLSNRSVLREFKLSKAPNGIR